MWLLRDWGAEGAVMGEVRMDGGRGDPDIGLRKAALGKALSRRFGLGGLWSAGARVTRGVRALIDPTRHHSELGWATS